MRFFQRLNYFTGLFTTADDWRREQAYHLHKHRLHNRGFHSPGVVPGEGENLAVTVTDEGKVVVLPGYAVDGRGHDLYLAEPVTLDIPQQIDKSVANEEVLRFISISFDERQRDPRPDHLNPQYSGDAFIEERPVVEWTNEAPNSRDKIELARVKWRAAQRITKDKIDTSHVRYVGVKETGAPTVRVSHGDTKLAQGEVKLLIGEPCAKDKAWGALFLANAFPKENRNAAISWSIESSITDYNQVQYHLCIRNASPESVDVSYEVYRLQTGGGN